MIKVVLLRHGESVWNKKGLFTGWVDVGLSPRGEREARRAGRKIKAAGFKFDLVFENYLKRCRKTTRLALKEVGGRPDVEQDWRLNERHYGVLQGLNKKAMVLKYGPVRVFKWRRSYSVRPPLIKKGSHYDQSGQALYHGLKVPRAESLSDVEKRVGAFWREKVVPALKNKRRILISASGNSLRALAKFLGQVNVKEVADLNIPTGLPLIYELDKNLKLRRHYYLASGKN